MKLTEEDQRTGHWCWDDGGSLYTSVVLDSYDQVHMIAGEPTNKRFAELLGLSPGRVSQMQNEGVGMRALCDVAHKLGVDVAVVVHERVAGGPISGEVLRRCWEMLGRPRDMWAIKELEEREK